MSTVIEFIKAGLATIGGYIAWFLGGFDGLLIALCVFALIDYLTGVIDVYKRQHYKSVMAS